MNESERLKEVEENVGNVAQYLQEMLDKQAEENRNMGLMVDNMTTRIGYLEEQLAMFLDAIHDIS